MIKAHYINCILEEIGFNSASGNTTCTRSFLSKEKSSKSYLSFEYF